MAIDPIHDKHWPQGWADPRAGSQADLGTAWQRARRKHAKPETERPPRRIGGAFEAPSDGLVLFPFWETEAEATADFEETLARVEILASRRASAYAAHGAQSDDEPEPAPGETLDAQA